MKFKAFSQKAIAAIMAIIISIIPIPASADSAPQYSRLEVGGYTPILDGEINATLSGKGWRYEQSENTLYLDNYSGPHITVENMGKDFKIDLSGNNTVKNFHGRVAGIENIYGWYSTIALYFLNTNVTFTGDGVLSNGEPVDYKGEIDSYLAHAQSLLFSFSTESDFHVTLSDKVTLKGTGYSTSITLDSYQYKGTLSVEKGARLVVETLPADYNESVDNVITADIIDVKGTLIAKRGSVNDKYSVFASGKYDDKGNQKQPKLKLSGVVMGYGQSEKSMKVMTKNFKSVNANYVKIAPKSEVKAASTSGKYKITYVLNGGKNNGDNPAKFNSGKKIALAAPYRYGYDFVGWYSDKKLTKKITSISSKTKSNTTVYAKWKKTTVSGTPTIKDIKYNDSTGGYDMSWKPVSGADGYIYYISETSDFKRYNYKIAEGSEKSEIHYFDRGVKQYFAIAAFKRDSAGEIVVGKQSKAIDKTLS